MFDALQNGICQRYVVFVKKGLLRPKVGFWLTPANKTRLDAAMKASPAKGPREYVFQ